MKLKTEQEIEEMAVIRGTHGVHCTCKGKYRNSDEIKGFKEGANWMQQDLLSQASKGFEEYAESVRGKDAFNPCDNDWTINEVEKAWQACSLSNAKKMQEKDAEIENLKNKIRLLEANQHFIEKEIRGE